jgi:DNA-binding MarR family transcriptional regulator
MAALDADLGWALGTVFRAYVKATDVAVGKLPGSHRGYQVLKAATEERPESQSALCQRLGIDRTVMTYLLDDLERADLVARRSAPHDRRTRLVVATDAGRERLADLERRLAHAETHVLSSLNAKDRKQFMALLGKVAAHANSLDPVSDACTIVEDLATHTP